MIIEAAKKNKITRAADKARFNFEDKRKRHDMLVGYIRKVVQTAILTPEIIDLIRPKKGRDYDDGKNAEVDYNELAAIILAKMPPLKPGTPGKDGKDGRDAHDPDEEKIIKAIFDRIRSPNKKIGVEDLDNMDARLMAVESRAWKPYGGHGSTAFKIGTTTTDRLTYTFNKPVQLPELMVYRSGIRVFDENGDYTANMTGDRVTSVTFAIQVGITEPVNFRGR